MKDNIIAKLTAKDDRYACALADKILSESRETDEWYEYFDDFASMLNHPKSLVRNRALHILAANVQWDEEGRFNSILPDYFAHITDEKPITARQCVQALAEVGFAKPQYIPRILSALQNADLSKYKDSMRPLLEKDMAETENILEGRKLAMNNRALVVIDLQNDITKNYKEIIETVNKAVDWAADSGIHVVYIMNHYLAANARTFKSGTHGAELVPEMKIVSENIFVKTRANALTSKEFTAFIQTHGITEFYIAGADATSCVKSTSFNMSKAGYVVHVLSDCITSYDKKKIDEMLRYYESKGCVVEMLREAMEKM